MAAQIYTIHPVNPQARLISRVVALLRDGAVVVYPTDSCYALGCHIGDKSAMERLRAIRNLDPKHHFTLLCRDLADIASYAIVENAVYRLLRANTPGPYTFILPASRQVPRRLQHPKRKTIGIRVPDNVIAQALLTELNEPLLTTSLILPNDPFPATDPEEISARIQHSVDAVIDAGPGGMEETSVIDLADGYPVVIRRGKGDTHHFEG